MGMYIYRVTAKTVKLDDGRIAHVAKYAYKPYDGGWGRNKTNARLHFQSGCVASESMTLKSDLLVTLNEDGETGSLYENKAGLKVFYDDATFGNADKMPSRGAIKKDGKVYGPCQRVETLDPITARYTVEYV